MLVQWGHLVFIRDDLHLPTNLPGQKKVSPLSIGYVGDRHAILVPVVYRKFGTSSEPKSRASPL